MDIQNFWHHFEIVVISPMCVLIFFCQNSVDYRWEGLFPLHIYRSLALCGMFLCQYRAVLVTTASHNIWKQDRVISKEWTTAGWLPPLDWPVASVRSFLMNDRHERVPHTLGVLSLGPEWDKQADPERNEESRPKFSVVSVSAAMSRFPFWVIALASFDEGLCSVN